MLYKRYDLTKSIIEFAYMCPQGLPGPPEVTLTKKMKYKKNILLRSFPERGAVVRGLTKWSGIGAGRAP